MNKARARWRKFKERADALTLIWAPQKLPGGTRRWWVKEGRFIFLADLALAPTVRFACYAFSDRDCENPAPLQHHIFALSMGSRELRREIGLYCTAEQGGLMALFMTRERIEQITICDPTGQQKSHTSDGEHSPELQAFIEQWLPLMRRNCFLSGAAIECTAHEQLEWQKCLEETGRD